MLVMVYSIFSVGSLLKIYGKANKYGLYKDIAIPQSFYAVYVVQADKTEYLFLISRLLKIINLNFIFFAGPAPFQT